MKQNREKLQTFCRYILLGFLILWGINHTVYAQEIDNFVSFNPGRASFKIKNFETVETYQIGKKKIAVGYYLSKDGKPTRPDTENDYGYRLVMVNEKNKIEYRSRGAMDVMKYRPFFYKNKSGKILIFCTLSFEYAAGAEVFLLENQKMKNIGTLDIDLPDESASLEKIVQITEKDQQIIFRFNAPKLTLDPGGENERIIQNDNIHYIFEKGKLEFNFK